MTIMADSISTSITLQTPHFTDDELELAQLFKAYGLEWTPSPGQFVLDQSHLIEVPSPFQERVYFILDLRHFVRRSGNIEELKQRMCWLPTWEDARRLLRQFSVADAEVSRRVCETGALAAGRERLELYRIIEDCLTGDLG